MHAMGQLIDSVQVHHVGQSRSRDGARASLWQSKCLHRRPVYGCIWNYLQFGTKISPSRPARDRSEGSQEWRPSVWSATTRDSDFPTSARYWDFLTVQATQVPKRSRKSLLSARRTRLFRTFPQDSGRHRQMGVTRSTGAGKRHGEAQALQRTI